MLVITELEQYDEDISRIMVNDPCAGDDDAAPSEGPLNAAAKGLANRTKYLKARIGSWMNAKGIATLADGGAIDPSQTGIQFIVTGSDNCDVTLGSVADFNPGDLVFVRCMIVGGKTCSVIADGAEVIQLKGDESSTLYMMTGEYLVLMCNTDKWLVLDCSPEIYEVGMCLDGYLAGPGQLIRNGATLNRADYARLWNWVSTKLSVTYSGSLVTESLWNTYITTINSVVTGETVSPYKGFFSSGNGTTTFRVPDDRGMHTRYMDFSRGISNLILNNYPGGYGHDWVKKHNHTDVPEKPVIGDNDRGGLSSHYSMDTEGKTSSPKLDNGNQGWQAENTVKATTKVPLIRC